MMDGDMNGMIDDFIEEQIQAEEERIAHRKRRQRRIEAKARLALLVLTRDNEIGGFVKIDQFPRGPEEAPLAWRARLIGLAKERAASWLAKAIAYKVR